MEKLFVFDFDGVIAFLFENLDLEPYRKEMNETLLSYGIDAREHGNMFTVSEVIAVSSLPDDQKRKAFLDVDSILRSAEMEAIEVADPVPGLGEVLTEIFESGIKVAVASNNNPDAVRTFLHRFFPTLDIPVWGRDSLKPENLKPSPYMIEAAMEYYGVEKEDTTFFGDAVSDMEAAVNAGVSFYGFIPSEKKRLRMEKVLPEERLMENWYELRSLLHLSPCI